MTTAPADTNEIITAQTTATAFDFKANGFEGDLLGYVENKGFKTPLDIANGYKSLESFVGDRDSLIRLPKERTPENMFKDVYSRLGASDKIEDYLKVMPVGEGGDATFAKEAAGWFVAKGIPVETAKDLAEKFNAFGEALIGQTTETTKAEHQIELVAYQKEKGATWEDTLKLVDTVAQTFGMSKDEVQGLKNTMGPTKAIKFLERIGAKLGTEGTQIDGDTGGNGFKMTPAAALEKIKALKNDPSWSAKFLGGDAVARAESEQLHKLAYPE